MWNLIPQKLIPPTRTVRYCCKVLKEHGGDGRFIATGVRWAESVRRANTRGMYERLAAKTRDSIIITNDNDDRRKLFENCSLRSKWCVNPIVDWTDNDVWNFINGNNIEVNPLYQEGFTRIGCLICPQSGISGRLRDCARWPKYKENYIKAFDRMLKMRESKGLHVDWKTGEECFHWWIEDGVLPGQMEMELDT